MPHEFINPNWHVILIHYPLGLFTIGLIIEIISMFKPKGGLRAAGRWMIGIGALLALPALTTGLYAMRDVVTEEPTEMETWHEVASKSQWTPEQWQFMTRHIWLNAVATGLGVIVVFLWLASGDRRRRRLYWFCLLAIIAANVFIGMGAWHGGEAVYRFGTGIVRVNPNPESQIYRGIDYWASPLQVHLTMAGLVFAAAIVGLALMFRRWEKPIVEGIGDVLDENRRRPTDPLSDDPGRDRHETVRADLGQYGEEDLALRVPPKVHPGWFYLTACALAVITAVFGYWEANGTSFREAFSGGNFSSNIKLIKEPDHRRLLLHVIFGAAIIVLPVLLGIFGRAARSARVIALVLTLLLVFAISAQIWLGVLLLYDGREGPTFRFAAATLEHHDDHDKSEVPKADKNRATPALNPATHPTTNRTVPSTRPTTRP
jgi:uncharacterized membrane protein